MGAVRRIRGAAAVLLLLAGGVPGGAPGILLLRPAGADFEEARKGLLEGLGDGRELQEVTVDRRTSPEEVGNAWRRTPPKVVVAMDNRAVALAREVRDAVGDTDVPVVALMGIRIDAAISGMGNAAGIAYEIPVVTSLVDLRSATKAPLRKAAMVYRASWGDVLRRNAEFCRREGIALVGKPIPDAVDPTVPLALALREIADDPTLDALVVPNDNVLLNARLLRKVWMPGVAGRSLPVVVGVESLVQPELDFGDFAVLPDHYAMGAQAAEIILEIEESGWRLAAPRIEEPVSAIQVLNARGMARCCRIRPGSLDGVDRVLK